MWRLGSQIFEPRSLEIWNKIRGKAASGGNDFLPGSDQRLLGRDDFIGPPACAHGPGPEGARRRVLVGMVDHGKPSAIHRAKYGVQQQMAVSAVSMPDVPLPKLRFEEAVRIYRGFGRLDIPCAVLVGELL